MFEGVGRSTARFLLCYWRFRLLTSCPDSKVHWANMGPIWVLSAPDGPHVGPMNLAIMGITALCCSAQAPHIMALCVLMCTVFTHCCGIQSRNARLLLLHFCSSNFHNGHIVQGWYSGVCIMTYNSIMHQNGPCSLTHQEQRDKRRTTC